MIPFLKRAHGRLPRLLMAVSAIALGLCAIPANAALLIESDSGSSTEGLGLFEGSFSFVSTGTDSGQITIELTNTSPAANGGFLTAFAFNNPDDLITDVELDGDPTVDPASDDFDFDTILGGPDFDDDVDANPFGDFDIGVSSTNSWLGGGSPNGGLAVGSTGTWILNVSGTDVGSLTDSDFQNAFNEGGSQGNTFFFIARFRGFEDDGSDKVPAKIIPEPTTLVMAFTSLIPVGLWRLNRLRRRSTPTAS